MDDLTAMLDKVLEEHGAALVDKKAMEESIRKAHDIGYRAGFVDANKRWWKVWRWI